MDKDRLEDFSTLIGSATKSLQKIKNKGMFPYGLASAHTNCIRILYRMSGGVTRAELARLCDVDRAQITRIIAELAEKQYIDAPSGERGSYRKKIKLTPEGVRIAEEINETVLYINRFVSGDIPEEQIGIFYATFRLICDRLKEAEERLDAPTTTSARDFLGMLDSHTQSDPNP
ncbi:MAG: hypothetical protein IJY42_05955 [Clostridia bacterium]|nr:hypothetical protein [Clostridia bacterium]